MQTKQEEETPIPTTTQKPTIPMQQYKGMCNEFVQMEGEIPCIRAVQLALENVGDTMITDIEKINFRGKNIYTISFEAEMIEIDASTGEIIQMVAK